jgi:2-keto-3-deoxy-L-rhamnonate aldolase RhmA
MNTKTTNCLQCGEPSAKRGLCGTCYSRFDKAKTRLSKDKKASFERALIESGKLLPKGKRSSKSYDPYGELADQLQEADDQQVGEIIEDFRSKNKKSQKPTVQQEAEDVVRRAKKAAKRKGITPKDRPEQK